MNNKTARWFNAAVRINTVVGIVWFVIGLRDLFAPHLFRFDGQVATTGTIILDFAAGAIFLLTALSLHKAKPPDLQSTS
jgi:hypothetical protein